MTTKTGPQDGAGVSSALRTPRAAGAAGIIFAVLLATVIVLLEVSLPADAGQPGTWLSHSAQRTGVAVALNLVPFAGIAFLWFIGVVRDRIGAREDRLFATVFLGSGLLFTGILFVAAAVAGGLIAARSAGSGHPGPAVLSLGHNTTSILLSVYCMRMAAVFTLTTVTIARRTHFVPRWLWVAGLLVAFVLLVITSISAWAALLFPAWILAVSIVLLTAIPGDTAGVISADPA